MPSIHVACPLTAFSNSMHPCYNYMPVLCGSAIRKSSVYNCGPSCASVSFGAKRNIILCIKSSPQVLGQFFFFVLYIPGITVSLTYKVI